MAVASTTFSGPAPYVAPPHFADIQDQINSAYKTALAKTQYQRSMLYTNAGFKDGTTQLDPTQQYGGVQQLLHNEGQALTQDDYAEHARGLNSSSGLGAQHAGQIRYGEHQQADSLGKTLLSGLGDLGNQDTAALATKTTATQNNVNDESDYNSQNAYNNALAAYLKSIPAQDPSGSAPQAGIGSSLGSYLPASTVAAAAAASTKARVGKVGNSGIHAQ